MPAVSDIISIMNEIAPPALAEGWDNPGLQAGSPEWPVKKVVVALDATPEVVQDACRREADLLITHHPFIFRALKRIDFSTPQGRMIEAALGSRLAVFSAHTNLDWVRGGLNDALAEKIGLRNIAVLEPVDRDSLCKLVVYVPEEYTEQFMHALRRTPAGRIGHYTACAFRQKGTGSFSPGPGADPFKGKPGELTECSEVRVEARIRQSEVDEAVRHLKKHHPYEEMAYDVYRLSADDPENGMGRTGELEEPADLEGFAGRVKQALGLEYVRTAGPSDMKVRRAAVCSGSGSGLLKSFYSSSADVFVSGDLGYHDARDAELYGRALIDAGHFGSEHLMVDLIRRELSERLAEQFPDIEVIGSDKEYEPFAVF